MDEQEYQEKRAELYALAAKWKERETENAPAAYFASWLMFFMDEQARWRNECENVTAAGRYLVSQLP